MLTLVCVCFVGGVESLLRFSSYLLTWDDLTELWIQGSSGLILDGRLDWTSVLSIIVHVVGGYW